MSVRDWRIGSMADLSLAGLVELVNRAYVGYPGEFTPEDLLGYAEFVRAQSIDLARSVLATDGEGAAVGFALIGIRGHRGWIGELGVVPEWRRRGVGRSLLAALLANARQMRLRDIRLEVGVANESARQLYERAGFQVARNLHNYAATAAELGLSRITHSDRQAITAIDLTAVIASGSPTPGPFPAWDHELPSLLAGGSGHTLVAQSHDDRVQGLIHCTMPTTGDLDVRLFVVDPADRDLACALLAAMGARPSTRIVAAYVPEESELFRLLPSLGFRELGADLEMVREVGPA